MSAGGHESVLTPHAEPATEPRESEGRVSHRRRVVYLLGAGATQGCASFLGSVKLLVMPGLIDELTSSMRDLVNREYKDSARMARLVNNVVDEDTDFEQLITFLEEAPSEEHKSFAGKLKIFSRPFCVTAWTRCTRNWANGTPSYSRRSSTCMTLTA
jgi:hypothetical protein